MQGKNIQATAAVLERKGRPNGGFTLRKSHGIEVPMAPPMVTRMMYLRDRKKMVVHESVCACGNRQAREAIMAAERQPVTTNDQMSAEESAPRWETSGTGSRPRRRSSPGDS
jgi:hypothetical protein